MNMDDFLTLQKLKLQVEPYLNTLVLDYFEVVRLVGVDETDEDFYYVYESLERGIYHSSCDGQFFKLKGLLLKADYYDLVRIFNLNSESDVKAV